MTNDYLLKILFTSLFGWILSFLTGSIIFGNITCVITICFLGNWFWGILGDKIQSIRLLRISVFFLVFLQNLMWSIAYVTNKFILKISIEETIYGSMKGGLTVEYYFLAIAYITAFSAMCLLLSSHRYVINQEKRLLSKITSLRFSKRKVLAVTLIVTTINLLLILSGVIGQRTLVIDGFDEGKIPFWYPIFQVVQPFSLFFSIMLISSWKRDKYVSKFNLLLVTLAIGSILIIFFSSGRRGFVFILITGFYLFSFLNNYKPKFYKVLIVTSILYPIFSFLLLINSYSRYNTGDIISSITAASEEISSSSSNLQEIELKNTQNYASRPLVATPLAYCLSTPNKSFTYGENLLNSLIQAIPSNSFLDKRKFPVMEELLYKHFKIANNQDDTADSIYLVSFTEFGWIGLIIFPLLIVLFWLLVIKLTIGGNYYLLAIQFSSTLLFFLTSIGEDSLTSWYIHLRTSLFLYFIFIAFQILHKNNARFVHRG